MNADAQHMTRALELAARGEGHVEPNPMVGCVIVRDGVCIGEGWHQRFGGPHAEVEALRSVEGSTAGATMYVTLEPCCHTGKTPPCTEAIIAAGIERVVVAQVDPFPSVVGQGIQKLRDHGMHVEVGLLESAAQQLNAPFRKLVLQHTPWVIAKWAMTLDGKLASRTGHSQWISNAASRQRVHDLRRRVDAIMVGRGTTQADDPLLTARPPGHRQVTRIVLDSTARLSPDSRLVKSCREQPVLVAISPAAASQRRIRLEEMGCELFLTPGRTPAERLVGLLAELGKRRMTNVLVEGGGELLGGLWDLDLIDEVHVFVAPKLVGGREAISPLLGTGRCEIPRRPHFTIRRSKSWTKTSILRDGCCVSIRKACREIPGVAP